QWPTRANLTGRRWLHLPTTGGAKLDWTGKGQLARRARLVGWRLGGLSKESRANDREKRRAAGGLPCRRVGSRAPSGQRNISPVDVRLVGHGRAICCLR